MDIIIKITEEEARKGTIKRITIPGSSITGELKIPAGVTAGRKISFINRESWYTATVEVEMKKGSKPNALSVIAILMIIVGISMIALKLLAERGLTEGTRLETTEPNMVVAGLILFVGILTAPVSTLNILKNIIKVPAYITGFALYLAVAVAVLIGMTIGLSILMGGGEGLIQAGPKTAWNYMKGTTIDIIKRDLPSCTKGDLDTPRARALKEQAHRIGEELEAQFDVELTNGKNVHVVESFEGGHHGIAIGGDRHCIKIIEQPYDADQVIRHEWSHLAVNQFKSHGSEWREVARKFGVETHRYAHCGRDDPEC